MKRNILLIHLESVNMLNYSLNKAFFPFLSNLEHESMVFNKFFSTATSTLMVIGDLMYSDMGQYESLENLNESDGPAEYKTTESIFDELKEGGYGTGIYIYIRMDQGERLQKKDILLVFNTKWNLSEIMMNI